MNQTDCPTTRICDKDFLNEIDTCLERISKQLCSWEPKLAEPVKKAIQACPPQILPGFAVFIILCALPILLFFLPIVLITAVITRPLNTFAYDEKLPLSIRIMCKSISLPVVALAGITLYALRTIEQSLDDFQIYFSKVI